MEIVKEIAWAVSVLLIVSCGVHHPVVLKESPQVAPPITQPHPSKPGEDNRVFLSGVFRSQNGEVIQLESLNDKPTILIFASEFCEICLKETKHIVERLQQREPSNVHIVTVVVGLDVPAWAGDWASDHNVSWVVGIDTPKLDLKNKYCGPAPVPCNIVQTPQKGIVLQKVGAVPVEELEQLTGTWETL